MKFISDFYQQKASNKDTENNCIELMWAGENLTNIYTSCYICTLIDIIYF